MACADSGMLTCTNQEAADRPAGAVLSIAPWRIKVVAQGREEHRVGEELLFMLAEVQGRPADFKQDFRQLRAKFTVEYQ